MTIGEAIEFLGGYEPSTQIMLEVLPVHLGGVMGGVAREPMPGVYRDIELIETDDRGSRIVAVRNA